MSGTKKVVQIGIKAVMPTGSGCAVFLGNAKKSIMIFIDQSIGLAISMALQQEPKPRPMTHDLIGSILAGFGARIERVIINDFNAGVFFARLVIVAENEIHERKILEIDARPSDCLALAAAWKAPVYITRAVWDESEDMTALLRKMEKSGPDLPPGETPSAD